MASGLTVLNISEYLNDDELREDMLLQILSEFSCEKNSDVEKFLKEQAINFTRKHQSVTYLVFNDEDGTLVGYFTLAIKPIRVDVEAASFSKETIKGIARVGEADDEGKTYTLSAYLIAQLGKNFANDVNDKITGDQLLQVAIDTVKEFQYMVGGKVVFLEAENEEKLLEFYSKNGFKRFDVRVLKKDTRNDHFLVQLLKIL